LWTPRSIRAQQARSIEVKVTRGGFACDAVHLVVRGQRRKDSRTSSTSGTSRPTWDVAASTAARATLDGHPIATRASHASRCRSPTGGGVVCRLSPERRRGATIHSVMILSGAVPEIRSLPRWWFR
jgi:hypothetical protein